MRVLFIASFAMVLSACQTMTPDRLSLPSGSPDSIILMKVRPARTSYELHISSYDKTERALQISSFGGWATLDVPGGTAEYVARKVKPGDYVVMAFAQQSQWALCFHDDSLGFQVKPGEVVYLGEFDPSQHFTQLQNNALSNRDIVASSSTLHHYFDNILPPQLTLNSSDEALAVAYVREDMAKVFAPVRSANLEVAQFGTGSTLFGEKICWGYGKKKLGNEE